jgi:hypothetical protein
MTGACHQSVLTGPPPPRFVGLNAGFDCACATPDDASICAARGAVRPRPTMVRVNWRRVIVPSFTRWIHCLRSRSSMSPLHRFSSDGDQVDRWSARATGGPERGPPE